MLQTIKWVKFIANAMCLLISGAVVADSEVTRIPIIDAPPGTVGLGFGYRLATSPYFEDEASYLEDEKLADLVPMYLYEGRYFFAHGTSYGLHLYRNDYFLADVLASYRFDRLDPDSSEFYEGIEKRDQTVDGGVSFTVKGNYGSLKFDWVTDLLNKHNGEEIGLTYRYRFDVGRWMFSPFFSYIYQNKKLTNYYYGISEDEARPGRPEYETDAAYFVRGGLNTSYQLTKHWLLYMNFASEGLDDSLRDSPLAAEESLGSVFVGGSYMFGDIFKASDVEISREKEWSWRVNLGYTAEGSISTDIVRGDLRKSKEVDDTGISGFTISKLVQGGKRVDAYARLAIFRHFEGDYQDDFWSYAPYVMLIGKGYTPWSEKLSFRWGFGLGFSYAGKVPIIEQVSQAKKGRDTSHFLNYLEWMLDFPLARITDKKSLRNCFVGITDVHRSGIFASADIFGNVAGGADWITFHLECLR